MKKIFFLIILIAVLASFFASAYPDGLEKVAASLGFIDKTIERPPLIAQALVGVFITFGLFWTVAALLRHPWAPIDKNP